MASGSANFPQRGKFARGLRSLSSVAYGDLGTMPTRSANVPEAICRD